jgi:hypothetical protein
MKKHKHYQQMRAMADGWEVEVQRGNGFWALSSYVVSDESLKYRIVPDKDGWIPWYPTEYSVCPIDNGQIVDIDTKITGLRKQYKTECWHWSNIWSNNVPNGNIITRYRLVEEEKSYASLKAARKDGKIIQVLSLEDEWFDVIGTPDWALPAEAYRIKTKTVKMWQWIIVETGMSPRLTNYFYTEAEIEIQADNHEWESVVKAEWAEIEVKS